MCNFIKLKSVFILLIIISFTNNFVFANEINYYNKYIYKEIILNETDSINKYIINNKNVQFTIGCVSKSIFGAGTLLFSQDQNNNYLFKNKGLEITIGELLNNRKNYIESLSNPTKIQQNKLDFINRLIPFIDERIMNVKVYQILNHTSVFADDFDNYILYMLAQKIVNIFSKNERELLILNIIQFLSLKNTEIIDIKYSNMGFMYLIKIMSLMTDKENFYDEINDRIFKPLKVEKNFIPVDSLTSKNLKDKFLNQNYYSKLKNKFIRINIYDLKYSEMDTLNGGLITDLNSAIMVTREISKMYFGFENLLTNKPDVTSKLFFKYKTIYNKSEKELYSLGTYVNILDNELIMKMTGNVFGRRTIIEQSINKIKNYKNDNFINYVYKKDCYNNIIKNKVRIEIANVFLNGIFFNNIYNFSNTPYSNNILAKSIYDEFNYNGNININEIELLINRESGELIKRLQIKTNKNINILNIEEREKKKLKDEFIIYFENLKRNI